MRDTDNDESGRIGGAAVARPGGARPGGTRPGGALAGGAPAGGVPAGSAAASSEAGGGDTGLQTVVGGEAARSDTVVPGRDAVAHVEGAAAVPLSLVELPGDPGATGDSAPGAGGATIHLMAAEENAATLARLETAGGTASLSGGLDAGAPSTGTADSAAPGAPLQATHVAWPASDTLAGGAVLTIGAATLVMADLAGIATDAPATAAGTPQV